MNGAWNTEKVSPRLQRFSGVSDDSSTGGVENMCREREESSGRHFGANAYSYGRNNGDGAEYGIRKDMDYDHNENSNSSMEEGVGDLPATYVPFGARPKQIQPLKGYSDSEGEDNEVDGANFVSWQPQQQNKQRQKLSSSPYEAETDQKHRQKPRDYEIEYEHRPWKRNSSYTSYSSKNSRGSKSSKTSRGSSASRKTPATHFSQHKEHRHHHYQQQQQRQQQSNTATSISPRRKLPMSSNDSQEDSVTSFLSQSIHSFESSDDSSVDGKERNKTVKAKGNLLDDKEGENSDSNHSPPSLDKISAIVDQVHREKQSRLASLQDGNVPVGKLPGGRTAAEPDLHADFGVDISAGKNHGIGATSSFKRSFTGSHAVNISDRTTHGEEDERTYDKGAAINQSFNISKLRNNKGKSFSSKDFDRRISLQKESSLRKVTVDVASIASREVEKFYSKRKQEKLEQKKLEMQQRRAELRFSVGRSESVARLKQADLWSSLNLGESEVELMRKKVLSSSTSSYRTGEHHIEDFNDSVDFGDDDAYEFERVVAEHEQELVGDTKGLDDDDRKLVRNLSSDDRDSNISLCGIGSPIGESDRYYEHQRENEASQFPPPNRSSTFVSSSASRPQSPQQPFPQSDAGESQTSSRYKSIPPLQTPPVTTALTTQTSFLPAAQEASSSAEPPFSTTDMKTPHQTPQSHITSTAQSALTGRKPLLPTAEKLSPPSQSSFLPTVGNTSSQTALSSSLPAIDSSSQTQTSVFPEAFSSDTLGTTITTQPLRNISSSSTARYKKRTSLEMVLEAASRASMTGDGDDFAAYPIDEYEDPYDRYDGVVQNAASVNRAMSFTSYNSGRSYNSEPVPMKQGAFSTSSHVDRGTGGSGFVPTSSSVDEAKSCSNAAVRRQSLPCKGSKATARRPARNKTIPSGDDYSHDGTNTSGGAGTVGGSVTFSYKDIYGSSEEDLNFMSDFPSVMFSSAGASSSSQYWLENGVFTHAVEGNGIAGTRSNDGRIHPSVKVGSNHHDQDDYGFGRRRSSNFEGAESDNARSSMVSIGLDKSNRSLGSSRQSFGSQTISADELDKLIEEEEEGHEAKNNKVKESTSWVKSLKRMSWLPVEMMQQHQQQPQHEQPKLKQRKTQSMYDLHDSDSDGSSKFGSSCSSFSSHSELSCFSNGDMRPMSKDKRRRRRERRRRRKQLNKRTSNLVKENPAPRSIRDILTSTNTGYDTEEEEDTVSVKSSLPSLAAAFGLDKELGKKSNKVPKRRGSQSSQSIQSNSVHSNSSRSGQVSRQQAVMQSHQQLKQSLSKVQPIHPKQNKPSEMGVYFDDRGWRTGGVGYETSEEDLLAGEMDFTSQSFECSKMADGTVDSSGWGKRVDNCSGDHDHRSMRGREELDKFPREPDYVNEAVQEESIDEFKRFTSDSVKLGKDLPLDRSDLSFKERIDELRRSSMAAVEDEDPAAFMGVAPKSEKMKNLLKMLRSAKIVSDNNADGSLNDPFASEIRGDLSRSASNRVDGGNEHNCDTIVNNLALGAEEYNSSEAKPISFPPADSIPPPKDRNITMESKRDSNTENDPPSRRMSATSQTPSTQSSHSNTSRLSHSEDAQSSCLGEVGLASAEFRVQSVLESCQSNGIQCEQVKVAEDETHSEDDKSSSPRSEQPLKTSQLSKRKYQQPNNSKNDSSPLNQQCNHTELPNSDHSRYASTAVMSSSRPGVDPLICESDMPLSSGYHQPEQSFSSGLQGSSYPKSLHGGESNSDHSPLLLHDQSNGGSVASKCLFHQSTLRHECETNQILPSPLPRDCHDTTIDIYPCHYGHTSPLQPEVDTSSQSQSDRLQNSQPHVQNQSHHCEDGMCIQSATRNPHALQHDDPENDVVELSSKFSNDAELQIKSDHTHRSKYNCASDQPDSPRLHGNAELSRSEHPRRSETNSCDTSSESMPHCDVNSVSSSKSEHSKASQKIHSAQLDSQPSDANAFHQSTSGYVEKTSPRKHKCAPVSSKNQDHATLLSRSEHPSPLQARRFEGTTALNSPQESANPSHNAYESPESNSHTAEKSSRLQENSPIELLESPFSKNDAARSLRSEKLHFIHSNQSEQFNVTNDVKATNQVRDDSFSVKSECLQNSISNELRTTDSLPTTKHIIHQNWDEKKKLPFRQLFSRSNHQRAISKESLDDDCDANLDSSNRLMSSLADLSQSCSSSGLGSKNGQPFLSRLKDHRSFDDSDDASKFWPAKGFDRKTTSNQSCNNITSDGLNDSAGSARNLFGIFAKKDSNNCTASQKDRGGKPEGTRKGSSEEIQTVNAIDDHVSTVQPVDEQQVVSLSSNLSGRTTLQKPESHQKLSISSNSIESSIANDISNESEAYRTRPRSHFLGRLSKYDRPNTSNGKDQMNVISDTNDFSEGSDTDGRQTREYSSIDDITTLSQYSPNIDPSAEGNQNALFRILRKNRSNCSEEEGNIDDPCDSADNCQIGGKPNQQGREVSKNGENINSGEATMTSVSMIESEENISPFMNDGVNGSENENLREPFQKATFPPATDPNNGTHGGNVANGAKQQISKMIRWQKNKTESEEKVDISCNGNEKPDQGKMMSPLNKESLNLRKIEPGPTSQQFDGSECSVCCAVGFGVKGSGNNEVENLCNASHSTGNSSAALNSPSTNGFVECSTSDEVESNPEGLFNTDGCTCIRDSLSHDRDTGLGTSVGGDCNPQMESIARNTSVLGDDELRRCCDSSVNASVDSDCYIGSVIVDTEYPDAEGFVENDSLMCFSNTQLSTVFLNHSDAQINPNPHFDSDEAAPSSVVSCPKDLTSTDSTNSIGDGDNVLSPGICIERDESMPCQEGRNLREGVTNFTQYDVISEDMLDHDPGNDNVEEGLSGDYCPSTDSEDDVFTHDEVANIICDKASDQSSEYEKLEPLAEQVHGGTDFPQKNAVSEPVAGSGVNKGHICNIGSHPDSDSKYSEDESSIDLADVFSNFSSQVQPFIFGKDKTEAKVAKTDDSSSDQQKQSDRDGGIFYNANDAKDIYETDVTDTFINIDDDSYCSSKSGGSVVWPKMLQNAQQVKDNDEGSFSTLHKQASQRSLVKEIFEDSDSGSDGNESVVWPKVNIDSDLARRLSGQSQNAERNVSIEECSQDSKYSDQYLVKTKTEVCDSNISPESSPDSLPSIQRQQSIKSIATMSTLDSLASPVDQMRAREQAAKGSTHHTMLLERQQSNSSFSSLDSYASPTQFLRDNSPGPARNTLLNEEKTSDDEIALRHYREHYQDFHDSNAHVSAARKQSMTSELSYTYEIELRQEFSEQLDELSTSIKGRDSRRFSFRPGRKSSIDSDDSESLESRDIFKTTGTLEDNNHFARSERSVVSRIEDLQASGFSNNFNLPGGSGMSVYSTDGIEDIDPNATDEGRDDFDFAMEAYANAMNFGHLDQRENDLEDNDHALAAKAYTGLGFARQCKGELDGALDAYMKSLQLWENEVGQDDPDNWDLQFTIGTVLKEMQRQLEASVHFNNALHLLKSKNAASGIHKGSILCTEGMIFSVMDKVDRALDCFRKALLVFQNSHHPLNLKFATIMFEMGSLLSQCDDYDDSANCYKFALEIRKARLGDSFLVARTYYSLGVTLASQEIQSNISTTSSSHLEEALRICQVEFEQNNLQSAIIIHALGVLNERKGDFLAASVWFTKERNMRKAMLGPDDESVAAVSSDLGTCYYNSGKYELAILLFRDSLRIKMLLDEDLESLEVADMLYKIASCHDSLCEYGEALHKFHEVKRIREAHYGPNSSPVVQAMLRIGNIQLGKGETKAALECFNEILGIGYANDSINAIEVANALYGRGCAQLCSFMLNDAMKSFTESLNWKLAALGEDDPGLACIFYQMAHVYLEQSDNEEAITCFEEYKRLQKLEKQRNLHDNAEICFAEGIVAKLQGRTEASLSFYKQSLAMFETLFGDEHEKVASIHFEIGYVLASVGDHDSALDHYKLCLEKRRQLLGSHVDVASVLYEIAQVYSSLSNAPLAAEYLHESMEMWKSKLGRVEKLASVCQLGGKMWKALRRHSEAQKNFEQALELYITIHGQHHETVATTLLDLGELLQEVNQLQQALFCFEESIQIRTDLFGQDDPSVAEVLYSKGVAMLFHKNFQAANDCLSRSLAIREQKLGPKDGAVGDTLNTIGFLQLRMGNIQGDDALKFLNQALEIRKAVGNKSKVVSTLQNIASVYKKRKQYDLCTEVYSDILAVRQEEFGKNDERVADAWINLGNVQTNANRIVEATVSYEEALRIRTLVHSYNHKSVAQVLFKIGSLNSRLNRYAVAKQLFEEYIRIRAEEVDDPDEEMAQALTLMGDLQKETGEKSKAQINWMSAIEIYTQLGYPEDHPKVSKLKSRQSTIPTGLFGTNRKSISSLADMSFGLLG